MALRDLSKLRNTILSRYNLSCFDKDTELPQGFSKIITTIGSSKVNYNKYTFSLVSSNGLYIFFPNQLWYVANNFVELYNELITYHEKLLLVFGPNKNSPAWQNIKDARNAASTDPAYMFVQNKLKALANPSDEALLLKFVTDFSWWNGGKGLERSQNDFYVSPIMSAAGLVNDSQGLLSSMCAVLAQNPIASLLLRDTIDKSTSAIASKPSHNFPLQQIYYGAPGTGKSHGIKSQESKFAEVIRTTFHPDSDYSTFVGAYKPTMKRTKKYVIIDKEEREITPAVTHDEYEERITYTFVKQAFLKAYIAAWKSLKDGKKILLVIEEINRGNCAQIFGDLFQLLDREESGYSSYPISADEDLHQVLEREFLEVDDMPATVKSGEELLLPPNLYIWATMNTSDQSLFPIDSAFKRRWDWKYVPISKKDTNYQIEVRKEIDVDGEMVKKTFRYDWWDFLDRVNTAIAKATSSEDKKLGYFFCKASKRIADTDKEPSIITADKFVGKVVFYLWNDVFKDFEIGDAKFRYGEDDLSLLSTKTGEDEVKREFSSFFDEEGNAKHEAVAKLLDDLKVEGKEVEDGGSEAKSEAAAGGFQE